jgi:hypothetical protein
MNIGRNEPCHCGSGQKYKKCCAQKDDAARSAQLAAQRAALSSAKAEADAPKGAPVAGQRPLAGAAPRPKVAPAPPPRRRPSV